MILHKHYDCNFTQIGNEILNDNRLSWKAKGLLCYLLSKPESWQVIYEDIVKRSVDGMEAVRSGIKELRNVGYVDVKIDRDAAGKILNKTMLVYGEPHVQDKPC